MKPLAVFFSLIISVVFWGCNSSSTSPNNAGYVTLLGNDTLAVEQFEKSDYGVMAKVVLRSPRTSFTSYQLKTSNNGGIEELTVTEHELDKGFSSDGKITRSYKKSGDSLVVSVRTNDDSFRIIKTKYESGILPFIDMVHWPFEIAFNNAAKSSADSIDQKLVTGNRASTFVVAKIDADSMTIRHPSRGVMGVNVDDQGNILALDASETTRKLLVKRVYDLDIEKVAEKFAKSDKNGNPFGSLSGAIEEEFTIGDAVFNVSYGSPQRRGRDLFGGIVPFGQRWRTGANSATHFKTSEDLKFGTVSMPAGEYTLFTIPEKDGGTLIINKQTGQNGRTYDESRDLGRVPMQVSKKEENTEGFTIEVAENGEGGVLKLIWGNTVYSVDFEIM
ncbi:MAG: DUF2911 domain-containing protein [Balneola sp.]